MAAALLSGTGTSPALLGITHFGGPSVSLLVRGQAWEEWYGTWRLNTPTKAQGAPVVPPLALHHAPVTHSHLLRPLQAAIRISEHKTLGPLLLLCLWVSSPLGPSFHRGSGGHSLWPWAPPELSLQLHCGCPSPTCTERILQQVVTMGFFLPGVERFHFEITPSRSSTDIVSLQESHSSEQPHCPPLSCGNKRVNLLDSIECHKK